jgi:hypothetical protein
MEHPQFASILIPPSENQRKLIVLCDTNTSYSQYQARCHGSRPISRADSHIYPSKPQKTFCNFLVEWVHDLLGGGPAV